MSSKLSYQQILDGSQRAFDDPIALRAGALQLLYDNGSMRHIHLNGIPILHQVYAAVRDHNWGTVPGEMHDVQLDIREDSFNITYTMHHQQNDIDFVWQAKIVGATDNVVTFSFEGEAKNSFRRNRIGFCILHPMTLAGKPCVVEHVDGSTEDGQFPDLISPHQPFFDIRAIKHEVTKDVVAQVLMEGATFEMEDQRNWIDASYKTYCTPLRLPFPVTVEAGERISQTITIRITGDIQIEKISPDEIVVVTENHYRTLPSIGLGLPSHGRPATERAIQRLQALNLAHVRADISLSDEDFGGQLNFAADYAGKVNAALELALFLSANPEKELARFAEWLKVNARPVARIAIFHENEKSTRRRWVELARNVLAEFDVPIGAGTNAFFTELNREHPPADLLDFVIYSINPQVHAFDNLSLAEALAAQVETVRTASSFSDHADIVVSPITFKMRLNPNATGAAPKIPDDALPPEVDPRQMSLFGAGWTLGSIKYLAQSGVSTLTYFETTGWRGVMETESGSPLPEKFASIAGAVYPMYHVFRALADFAGGDVQLSTSSQPLKVVSLFLGNAQNQRTLLANLTAKPQVVSLEVAGTYDVRRLDAENAVSAMQDPETFWRSTERRQISSIGLSPYALAILDKV